MGLDHGGPHQPRWRACTLSNEVLGSHQKRKYSGGKMEDRFQIQRPRVKSCPLLQFFIMNTVLSSSHEKKGLSLNPDIDLLWRQ